MPRVRVLWPSWPPPTQPHRRAGGGSRRSSTRLPPAGVIGWCLRRRRAVWRLTVQRVVESCDRLDSSCGWRLDDGCRSDRVRDGCARIGDDALVDPAQALERIHARGDVVWSAGGCAELFRCRSWRRHAQCHAAWLTARPESGRCRSTARPGEPTTATPAHRGRSAASFLRRWCSHRARGPRPLVRLRAPAHRWLHRPVG